MIALALLLIAVVVGSYLGWTAAISDRDENTAWSVLLSIAFYGSLLALVVLVGRVLRQRRARKRSD